jgi:AcrR family transcriptional regulator
MGRRAESAEDARAAAPGRAARAAATRARVVEAAARLFSQYGFRRASMDEIAAAARIAKPTLYAYFPDKDALFAAVVESVLASILANARSAAGTPGRVEARLAAVLSAKFTYLFDLVDRSPHAAELVGSGQRLGAADLEAADQAFASVVRQVVEAADAAGELDLAAAGLSSHRLTEALLRAGHGASYRSETAEAHARHLAELVGLLLAGCRPR